MAKNSMGLTCFAVLGLCQGIHGADDVVTLNVYENTALAGSPSKTSETPLTFELPGPSPFSAEAIGTLEVQDGVEYTFDCKFSGADLAFFFVDDHLVCQSGAYSPAGKVNGIDNPLRKLSKAVLPVRLEIYHSGASTTKVCKGTQSMGCFNDTNHQCGFHDMGVVPSNSWDVAATACQAAGYELAAAQASLGQEVWCGHKVPSCPKSPDGCKVPCPGNHSELCGDSYQLEVFGYTCEDVPSNATGVSVDITWSEAVAPGSAMATVPSARLGPLSSLPPEEFTRRALQRNLTKGWGTWMHNSVLDQVQLPSGAVITTAICEVMGSEVGNCQDRAAPDDTSTHVGVLAYDRSYGEMWVSWSPGIRGLPSANVSLQFSGGDGLSVLATPVKSSKTLALVVFGRAAWKRVVNVTSSTGISTVSGDSISAMASRLTAARAVEMQRYQRFGDLAEVKAAAQAGVMWNYIYNPVEFGPLAPVSRGWSFTQGAVDTDWTYVIFDWDNIFASYLLSIDSRDLAYSNYIQVIKSKTVDGFVPNFAAAQVKSSDRTEPPIGAKVLLEMYTKYKDQWLVKLLFDDLLDWSNWFLKARRLDPLGLICLGSADGMQGARYESGLDNSPMYDGNFWDEDTHLMQLYDVGMSSMFTMEADALASLADSIGRTEGNMLRQRAASMQQLILNHLWDSASGIFVNLRPNNTFYRRISPTSFYPLMTRGPSTEQVTAMMSGWMMNKTRFCITPNGDFAGNSDTCYWGLPSISADDPAFPPPW
eukprot:gene2855-3450_t